MKNTKLFTAIIFFLGIFYVVFPALAQEELSDPNFVGPNTQDSEVVDVNVARFAALQYAQKFYGATYGEMKVYDVATYYDIDDQPTVYAVTLISIKGQMPTLEKLIAEIQDKHNAIEKLKETLLQIDSEPISGKSKSKLASSIRAQVKMIEKQLRQDDRFITVLCGATEEHVPVIRAYQGLPEHLTLLPSIQKELISNQELNGYQPSDIYYLGIFDQAYSLGILDDNEDKAVTKQKNKSDQKVIHLRGKKVSSKSEIRKKINQKKAAKEAEKLQLSPEKQKIMISQEEERKSRISTKWERIKKQYERKKHSQSNGNYEKRLISSVSKTNKEDTEESINSVNNDKKLNMTKE